VSKSVLDQTTEMLELDTRGDWKPTIRPAEYTPQPAPLRVRHGKPAKVRLTVIMGSPMQEQIERLKAAVRLLAPPCLAILGSGDNVHRCGEPADWLAEWSGRQMYVCDRHKHYADAEHNGDHSYDQTGILWSHLDSGRIAREALA
jgi:hypothetical protein